MSALLSFEQAPPISVPFRFFLTAPAYAAAAGILIALEGPGLFESRWAYSTLAATHLMTLGFMLQIMCGALLQILPVAAGGNVWRPTWVATIVHLGLNAGTVLLVAAFLAEAPPLFRAAGTLLAVTLGIYVAIVGIALIRTPATGPTVLALRLALPALVITLGLGVALSAALGGAWTLPIVALTQIHAGWGLLGWALVLLAGVSFLVVPMFQLTPNYGRRFSWLLPALILASLGLWTAMELRGDGDAYALPMLAAAGAFGAKTLWLQQRRRRQVADATLLFWRLAMICLLAAVALPPLSALGLAPSDNRLALLIGVLALFGVFMSAIAGMLAKIVPFLCWLHLQRITAQAPNMKQMIPERRITLHYRLHIVALSFLLAAVFVPELTRLAGLALLAASLWLAYLLGGAVLIFRRVREAASGSR